MKSKDQTLLEEAYEQITLKSSEISEEQGKKLAEKAKKIKERIKFLKELASKEEYVNEYDPQARVAHTNELKKLHSELSRVKRQYYGE
jgi:type VI protein secretion system component VasK